MIIKLNGKFYDICWDEVYHETHDYFLKTQPEDCGYTLSDKELFWKNLQHKKVGKGYQVHIQINTLADKELFEKMLYDISHHANLQMLDGTDVAFHKKALLKIDELYEQLRDWKKSLIKSQLQIS